ncbi:hypothetical protein K2173_026008 [Erythroxylum novogranatense]|uniref:Uncharacterized protein n=1 Tax=Erythroxylum novogranatense TaxID=1862640 RepID=A0AAV8SIS7_9ROSI|nr:hypothetical protein K2173_026008 [Erythroxylum novogranatense]
MANSCTKPVTTSFYNKNMLLPSRVAALVSDSSSRPFKVRASLVDSSADFLNRLEKAWLISQQPGPVACSSCNSNRLVECKWCGGTGFFILGNEMLCQVPSRNTSCVICAGKGSVCCSDCKGTGFRAKWLGKPPISR